MYYLPVTGAQLLSSPEVHQRSVDKPTIYFGLESINCDTQTYEIKTVLLG